MHSGLPIQVVESCWIWQARIDSDGYGRKGRESAHRYVYKRLVGPIPEGKELDHTCRNRACVNPSHLEPVTHRENLMRGVSFSARNASKTMCPRGHEYSKANTYHRPNGAGRECRICMYARVEANKKRQRTQHAA